MAQVNREAAAVEKIQEPEHPEYAAIDLNLENFNKYFSCSISVENFRNWEETVEAGYTTLYFQYWSCDYVLRATAMTPYKFENVRFDVTNSGVKANAEYGARGVTFKGVTMPQSGEATRSQSYRDSYMNYGAIINSPDDVLNETAWSLDLLGMGHTSVQNVSGRVFIPWAQAKEMFESKYRSAQKAMDDGSYQLAMNIYKELAEARYKDAAQLLLAAEEKLAAQKEQKQKEDYASAFAALENGDFDAAIKGFKALGDYEDSKNKLAEANDKKYGDRYEEALAFENSGRYAEAIAAFKALNDYKDSAARAAACEEAKALAEKKDAYEAAEAMEAAGDYVGAYNAFFKLQDFENSINRAEQLKPLKTYQQIEVLMSKGDYAEARKLLEPIEHEEKARQLIRTCNLREANLFGSFNGDGSCLVYKNPKRPTDGGGMIDIEGKYLLPLNAFDDYTSLSDGRYLVKDSWGDYGYLSARGTKYIDYKFHFAENFHQGGALVSENGKYRVIDSQGSTLGEMPVKKGRQYLGYVGEGLVAFKEKEKVGLINLKGKVVLKPKYVTIGRFKYGLSTAYIKKNNKSVPVMINAKGKEVKIGKNTYYGVLSENLFTLHENRKSAFVDKKGKLLSSEKYDMTQRKGDLIQVQQESGFGLLDLELNQLIPCEWENIHVGHQGKVVALKKDGAYRVYRIDDLQTPLIPGESVDVRMNPDSPSIAWYDNDLGWFVYDSEGNLIH